MKETIKNILKALPFDITKNQKYDTQTQKIIRSCVKEDSNCVDVGCHKGEFLDLLLAQAPKGTHYAFEPIPDMFKELEVKYTDENCKLYCLGLSNEQGESTFNLVISNPAYSGFVKREYDRPNEEDTTITVKKDLLDNIIGGEVKVDFIKVDVEGAELEVFGGAKQVIKRSRPIIVFEHGKGAADCYGTTPSQVYDVLVRECDLRVNLMERFLKKQPPLEEKEFVRQFEEGLNHYFIAYPADHQYLS